MPKWIAKFALATVLANGVLCPCASAAQIDVDSSTAHRHHEVSQHSDADERPAGCRSMQYDGYCFSTVAAPPEIPGTVAVRERESPDDGEELGIASSPRPTIAKARRQGDTAAPRDSTTSRRSPVELGDRLIE